MIISIDAQKAFDQSQHPLMIKTLKKLGIEGKYQNIIKAVSEKSTANIIKLKAFLLNQEKGKGCPRSPLLFSIILEGLGRTIRQQKVIKSTQIGKEEGKLFLFANDMLSHTKNPEDPIKVLL